MVSSAVQAVKKEFISWTIGVGVGGLTTVGADFERWASHFLGTGIGIMAFGNKAGVTGFYSNKLVFDYILCWDM